MHTKSCTTLDHIYPVTHEQVVNRTADGTPCYCGRRRWNQDSPSYRGPAEPPRRVVVAANGERKLRKGTAVELRTRPGVITKVAEVDREAGMIRVAGLDGWHELTDVL